MQKLAARAQIFLLVEPTKIILKNIFVSLK